VTTFANPQATWNQRFASDGFLFGEEPNQYLSAQLHHLKPGNTLAIADGEGRNSVWLAKQGLHVDAFDFAPNAIEKAKHLAHKHSVSVSFSCTDWQSFEWKPAHYDNIVGVFFQFAGPQDRADLFARMDASLKPGGVLLIQGYTAAQLKFNTGGPGKLDHLYDETLLTSAFAQYKVLDMQTYEAEIHEGTAHSGMSGLIGFTAQKPL
jgi:cyclopropane fatty-acyl-phospholipid synthase-like methyltransferase